MRHLTVKVTVLCSLLLVQKKVNMWIQLDMSAAILSHNHCAA